MKIRVSSYPRYGCRTELPLNATVETVSRWRTFCKRRPASQDTSVVGGLDIHDGDEQFEREHGIRDVEALG